MCCSRRTPSPSYRSSIESKSQQRKNDANYIRDLQRSCALPSKLYYPFIYASGRTTGILLDYFYIFSLINFCSIFNTGRLKQQPYHNKSPLASSRITEWYHSSHQVAPLTPSRTPHQVTLLTPSRTPHTKSHSSHQVPLTLTRRTGHPSFTLLVGTTPYLSLPLFPLVQLTVCKACLFI